MCVCLQGTIWGVWGGSRWGLPLLECSRPNIYFVPFFLFYEPPVPCSSFTVMTEMLIVVE